MSEKYYFNPDTKEVHRYPGDGSLDDSVPDHFSPLTEAEALSILDTPASVEGLKLIQTTAVYNSYDKACRESIPYMATTFQATDISILRVVTEITTYSIIGAATEDYYWLDSKNVKIPMNLDQLKGLLVEMSSYRWKLQKKLQDLKDKIRKEDKVDQLKKITWLT